MLGVNHQSVTSPVPPPQALAKPKQTHHHTGLAKPLRPQAAEPFSKASLCESGSSCLLRGAMLKVNASDLFLLPGGLEAAFFALTMLHKKIQSLECKNTRFEHNNRAYGLLTSRHTTVNLRES